MYRWIASVVASFGDPIAAFEEVLAGRIAASTLFSTGDAHQACETAATEIAEWQAKQWSFLSIGDVAYPAHLYEVADAPPLLFVEGSVDALQLPGVAIVGTRRPSADGIRRAQRAAKALADAGLVVYSGLAKGIDTAAHEAALTSGGLTVAVMGTPINRRYPSENAPLATRIIASGGTLVTEFVPESTTRPWHFIRRNRTMSGLALATLVIEASDTSGARSQAVSALDQGRPVFFPDSLVASHEWARKLVDVGRNGVRAICVSRPRDVAEALSGNAADSAKSAAF
ncbi:MAG TPA: DNA-processing protein DprA [Gemmatimonadaceae bacterium]|nr:DNA-processing protein DprA [Gemmatimonadaceae bacterium]